MCFIFDNMGDKGSSSNVTVDTLMAHVGTDTKNPTVSAAYFEIKPGPALSLYLKGKPENDYSLNLVFYPKLLFCLLS